MADETENIRRAMVHEINTSFSSEEDKRRFELEAEYGQVWDTDELTRDFVVEGFMAPFCVVRRRFDGAVGSLMFCHHPRFYFNFQEDRRGR